MQKLQPIIHSLKQVVDERGKFTKVLDIESLKSFIGENEIYEVNLVRSKNSLTFRGFHFQVAPYEEIKCLSVVQGSIIDLSFDPKIKLGEKAEIFAHKLTDQDNLQIIIPKGFAHGYLTLQDDTTVIYGSTEKYSFEHERGIRWDDDVVNWEHPKPFSISSKDGGWKNYFE